MNHIFAKGHLSVYYRSLTHRQDACGKLVDENTKAEELMSWCEGVSEDKSLRLIGTLPISLVLTRVGVTNGIMCDIDRPLIFLRM